MYAEYLCDGFHDLISCQIGQRHAGTGIIRVLCSLVRHVADTLMRPVYPLRIDAVKLTHALGEISFRCFDYQMIMIGHLAVGVALPVKP